MIQASFNLMYISRIDLCFCKCLVVLLFSNDSAETSVQVFGVLGGSHVAGWTLNISRPVMKGIPCLCISYDFF